jgi:hypothetical protein
MKHPLLLACLLLAGCRTDPAAQSIIDTLPPDSTPNGPLHRAGQPCLACHDKYGGATELAIGGTVYALDAAKNTIAPLPNVRITIVDSNNADSRKTCSNAAGNFFLTAASWPDITFPLTPTAGGIAMASLVGRDGSCASCHQLPGPTSLNAVTGAGHDSAGVILVDPTMTDPTCAGGGP